FTSNRCWSHFSSIGPAGLPASNEPIISFRSWRLHDGSLAARRDTRLAARSLRAPGRSGPAALRAGIPGTRTPRSRVHHPQNDQERHAHVTDGDHRGESPREVTLPEVVLRIVDPEAVPHGPRAVEDVDPERDVGDDVNDRHRHALKTFVHVV